jgi:hypothetical protein
MSSSHFLKRLLVAATFVLIAISLLHLSRSKRTDSLLGLWDSGRFSSKVMPELARIPEEQLQKMGGRRRIMLQASPDRKEGQNLVELYKWYDLDQRYVDATVRADALDPTRIPSDPFEVVLINSN